MSAFGKIYSNRVTLYFVTDENNFKDMYEKLKLILNYEDSPFLDMEILAESKQNKREEFDYVKLPLVYYEFSVSEFEYARDYIKLNGYKGKIPKLYFDANSDECRKIMSPILKFGIIHTKGTEGFRKRKPQIVMKLAQEKMTESKRGKAAKVKGLISAEDGENFFLVRTDLFMHASGKMVDMFTTVYPDQTVF